MPTDTITVLKSKICQSSVNNKVVEKFRKLILASSIVILLLTLIYLRYYASIVVTAILIFASVSILYVSNKKIYTKFFSQKFKIVFIVLHLLLLILFLLFFLAWNLLCKQKYFTDAAFFIAPENFEGDPFLYSTKQLHQVSTVVASEEIVNRLKARGWIEKGRIYNSVDPRKQLSNPYERSFTKDFSIIPFFPVTPHLTYEVVTGTDGNEKVWLGKKTPYRRYIPGEISYGYFHQISRFEVWLIEKQIVNDLLYAFQINFESRGYSEVRLSESCFEDIEPTIP